MAVSNAQILANRKYRAANYDVISIEVRKGKRDDYNAAAKELNISLKMLIQSGVEEYIKNHGGAVAAVDKQQDDKKFLSPADERLLDDLAKLPPDAQKAVRQLVRAITAPANDDDQRRQKN